MSRVKRRKRYLREMNEDYYDMPEANQTIVRIVNSPGNNLHEVETANEEDAHFLVSMPNKYRNNIWVKCGDCVLIEPIKEGDKVKGEICKILTSEHRKHYTKAGIWPERFVKKSNKYNNGEDKKDEDSDSDSDSDSDDLEPNMNRPRPALFFDNSEEDDESTSSSEDL